MILILELSDNKEAALKAKAQSQDMSPEQFVQRMIDRELAQEVSPVNLPKRRISQRIAEIMADVPAEAFASLPKDGARQLGRDEFKVSVKSHW